MSNSNSYDENDFICEICIFHKNEHDIKPDNIYEKCTNFLEKINLNKQEIEELEVKTREQRYSTLWQQERKIRVTSSYFGKICKVRDVSS